MRFFSTPRLFMVAAAAAVIGLASFATAADAQRGGFRGGGFRAGGFSGGAFRAGGFRGGFAGPAFRTGGFARSAAFRAGAVGPAFRTGIGRPGFRWAGRPFPYRHRYGYRPFLYGAAAFPLAYAGYSIYRSYDDCVVPRRVWTPYGWRIRLVDVCGYY